MVSTTATARGILEVDSSHPLRPVMTIMDKLFQAFTVLTGFALIRKAESKGYTAMSIKFHSEQEIQQNRFLISAATVSVTANSTLIEQWNLERKKVATAVSMTLSLFLSGKLYKTWKINGLLSETPVNECSVSTHVARSRLTICRRRWGAKGDGFRRNE
jgi:hypothetical protein